MSKLTYQNYQTEKDKQRHKKKNKTQKEHKD